MNVVHLVGRVAREPQLRKTVNGKSYMFLTLAVSYWDRREQKEKADFISCVAWGKEAERCQHLVKGSLVRISGRIGTGSFKDKSGETQYRMEVVVEEIDFLSKPRALAGVQGDE